jgi:hypothetical protein
MIRTVWRAFLAATAWCCLGASGAECIDQYKHLFVPGRDLAPAVAPGPRAPRLSEIKAGHVTTDFAGKPIPRVAEVRTPDRRPNLENLEKSKGAFTEIVVKFRDDSLASSVNGVLTLPDPSDRAALAAIVSRYPQFQFQPAHSGGSEWLTAIRFCALVNTGKETADLTSYFSAPITMDQKPAAVRLVRELLDHPIVETVLLRPLSVSPAADIYPLRHTYGDQQHYWDPLPTGINIRRSWSLLGAKGDSLRYVTYETGGWTLDHDDFPNITLLSGSNPTASRDQGTALLGIL